MKSITMKTALFTTVLFGLFALPFSSPAFTADFSGSLKKVTITDSLESNKPPSAAFVYLVSGENITFDASDSFDPDGTIAKYKWDFGDGSSGEGVKVTHEYLSGKYHSSLTVIDDDGGVAIIQQEVATASVFALSINFQPAASPVPANFKVDSGALFEEDRGYGWTSMPKDGTRDRDNAASPDQSYDTNIMPRSTDVWKVALPSGNYKVVICVGDPWYPSSTNIIQIEGVEAMNETVSSVKKWAEKTIIVNVLDGEMTFTFTDSPSYLQICWITIQSV